MAPPIPKGIIPQLVRAEQALTEALNTWPAAGRPDDTTGRQYMALQLAHHHAGQALEVLEGAAAEAVADKLLAGPLAAR